MISRIAMVAAAAFALAACERHTGPPMEPVDSPERPTEPASAPSSATSGLRPTFDMDVDGTGTQPLWTLKIRSEQMELAGPDRPRLTAPNPGPAPMRVNGVWTGVWEAPIAGGSLKVTLEPGVCEDGRSDKTYAYKATVLVNQETLKGCAERVGS